MGETFAGPGGITLSLPGHCAKRAPRLTLGARHIPGETMRHQKRHPQDASGSHGVRIAIGMSGPSFPLAEYRPYTLISPVAGPKGPAAWTIVGALVLIVAIAGLVLVR